MKFKLILALLTTFYFFDANAQKLETQGGIDDKSVSTKMKDGVSSSRIIVQSSIPLSYNTNMGEIPKEDIGSGLVNGLNVDTLYFYLHPFDNHRRLIISSNGYVSAKIDLQLPPKSTYVFSVLEPTNFSDEFIMNERKYEEGCRQYDAKSWISAINTFIPLAASGHFEAEEKLCLMFRDIRIREKLPQEIYSKFAEETEKGKPYAQYITCTQYLDKYGLVVRNEQKVISMLESAALSGNSFAQTTLASCYQGGTGVKLDFFEAVKWYERAATLDDTYALLNLSIMINSGMGVKMDKKKSWEMLNKAATLGNEFAMEQIGVLYVSTSYNGIENNSKDAFNWLQRAGNNGCDRAWAQIAQIYMQGKYVSQDLRKTMEYLKKGVDLNDTFAMALMGVMYTNGLGVKADNARGMNWYKKASDLGDRYGMYFAASSCFNQRDYNGAWNWYKKAGDNRYFAGYYEMGKMCEQGNAPKGTAKADCIQWYGKAASLGGIDAIKRLIEIYSKGEYVGKNLDMEMKWVMVNADMGDIPSMLKIADALIDGKGVEMNEVEAIKYLERAASIDSKEAMLTLAKLYREGIGVLIDEEAAKEWTKKAQRL